MKHTFRASSSTDLYVATKHSSTGRTPVLHIYIYSCLLIVVVGNRDEISSCVSLWNVRERLFRPLCCMYIVSSYLAREFNATTGGSPQLLCPSSLPFWPERNVLDLSIPPLEPSLSCQERAAQPGVILVKISVLVFSGAWVYSGVG